MGVTVVVPAGGGVVPPVVPAGGGVVPPVGWAALYSGDFFKSSIKDATGVPVATKFPYVRNSSAVGARPSVLWNMLLTLSVTIWGITGAVGVWAPVVPASGPSAPGTELKVR